MNTQYIIDETGKCVSVVLPVAEYEALLEDLDDLAAVAERHDEDTVEHAELIAKLKADAIL
ncbi:MAG: hypothetical protein U1F68_15725 [Gammaproteobacteria bacterium]